MLLGTGFPLPDVRPHRHLPRHFQRTGSEDGCGQRRQGSLLDFSVRSLWSLRWFLGWPRPWDMAAGALLISEAGESDQAICEAIPITSKQEILWPAQKFCPLLKIIEDRLPESVRG